MFEAVRELLGGRISQVLGQRALRCCCCGCSLSPPSCCNTSSFSGQQPSWRSCSPRASTHRPPFSSSRMAAVLTMRSSLLLLLLLLLATLDGALAQAEEHGVEELQVETLVQPENCPVRSKMGDTLHIHYTGKLMDGKVIDSSLSMNPLVVVLGKRTVIPGLEQSLIGVCEGQKLKATIPSHLAYGKKGYPPTVPGDAALEFEVEVVSLMQQTPWQKMVNDVFPLVCLALVPTLLGLVGLYLYKKANAEKPNKRKAKDKKSKKK